MFRMHAGVRRPQGPNAKPPQCPSKIALIVPTYVGLQDNERRETDDAQS